MKFAVMIGGLIAFFAMGCGPPTEATKMGETPRHYESENKSGEKIDGATAADETEKMPAIVTTVDDHQTATVVVDISDEGDTLNVSAVIVTNNEVLEAKRTYRNVDRLLASNERCSFCDMPAMNVDIVPFHSGALGQSSN